jgi:hypothetical protein
VPVTIPRASTFCPPANAMQTNAMTRARVHMVPFFLLVLSLVLLLLSVTEWCPIFSWQISNKPV